MNERSHIEPRVLLAILLVLAALSYDFCITYWRPMADPTLVGTILGVLNGTGFSAVVQYYLGSSKGSETKDQTINALSNK